MNRVRAKVLALVLVVAAVDVGVATASTTNGDRQAIDVRSLKQAADAYFLDTGQYPMTDASGTWFQKLVAADYIRPDYLMCGTPPGAPLPLDLFGQPLVYEVPNPKAPGSAIVRCVGKDGVDDQGSGDDFDSRFGPNLGYWNKSAWPRFFAFTFGGWVIALAIGFIVWFVWQRRLAAAIACLLIGGVIAGLIVPILFNAGFMRTSATRLPNWGNTFSDLSCMAVPAGLILLVVAAIRFGTRRRRLQHNLCPACEYPMGTSPVCTECGETLHREPQVESSAGALH